MQFLPLNASSFLPPSEMFTFVDCIPFYKQVLFSILFLASECFLCAMMLIIKSIIAEITYSHVQYIL